MDKFPNYSENVPNMDNHTWVSEYHPTYDFMEGIMWLGNVSIAGMFPAYQDVSGFKLDPEDLLNFEVDRNLNINDLIWDNSKPLVFIIVGLIYVLAMMIVGIVWCCCKICSCCCCKGKKRRDRTEFVGQEDENRRCSTKKIVYSIFMATWIFLFVCILVSAFTMTVHINNSISDLPDDIDRPLTDTESYLNITKEQFKSVFVRSYADLEDAINNLVDPSTPTPRSTLDITKDELAKIKHEFGGNSVNILTSIGLMATNYSAGTSLLNKYFEKLSSTNSQMENLDANVSNTVEFASASNFFKSIEDSQYGVNLRDVLPRESLDDLLVKTRNYLKGISDEFAKAIDSIDITNIRSEIEALEDGLETGMPWVYVTMYVVYAILIAILLAIVVGTIFVGFQKEKSTKTFTGPSVFFNSGTLGIFITGFCLMCLCLALYVFSGLMQIVCQGIKDLENPGNASSSIGRNIRTFDDYVLPSYEKIIESCKLRESAYKTMELHQVYDIAEIKRNLTDRFENEWTEPPPNSQALEKTLSSMKVTIKDASTEMKEWLVDANSYLKTIDNNGTPDLKHIESLKSSFEKQKNGFNGKIAAVENQLALLSGTRFAVMNKKRQGRQGFEEFKEKVLAQVNNYGDFVHDITLNEVGECGPMYRAYDVTLDTFCYKMAFPIAGFWITLTFLLLLYIPLLITIVVLRKVD